MLAQATVVGFVPVREFASAEAFYAGKLGLKVVDRTNPFAIVFQAAGGVTIRCALVLEMEPQPFTILGWEVAEIGAASRELAARGVEMIRYPHFEQDQDGVWTAPGGAKVAWFHDPFGNVLSLSQQPGWLGA